MEATRVSPGAVSKGIPIFITLSSYPQISRQRAAKTPVLWVGGTVAATTTR